MCILYVDEPWHSEVTRKGVFITYRSGGEVFKRQMSRADYRKGLEIELRKLNEFERNNRCDVVPIKRKRRAH